MVNSIQYIILNRADIDTILCSDAWCIDIDGNKRQRHSTFICFTFSMRSSRDALHDRPAESALVGELDVLDDHDASLRELNADLDDRGRNVDSDGILSRVVRD